MLRLGVLSALAMETAAFVRGVRPDTSYTTVTCGVGIDAAKGGAHRLIENNVDVIASWGVAGGLHESLQPGDLLMTSQVSSAVGFEYRGQAPDFLRVDTSTHQLPLITVETVAETPSAKAQLHARFGAYAVDMESAGVAAVCNQHGIPFVAIRAILDVRDDVVPAELIDIVSDQGHIRLQTLGSNLLRHPQLLIRLPKLARRRHLALRALTNAARNLVIIES